MIRHSLFQCRRHRSLPPSSCGQAPPIWSSSSTLTPSWGMDRSSGGKSSTGPASQCGRRLTVWAHSPTRFGIWNQTRSTASVSCLPGPGKGEPERPAPLWSAGQSVQVSQMERGIILHIIHVKKQISFNSIHTKLSTEVAPTSVSVSTSRHSHLKKKYLKNLIRVEANWLIIFSMKALIISMIWYRPVGVLPGT